MPTELPERCCGRCLFFPPSMIMAWCEHPAAAAARAAYSIHPLPACLQFAPTTMHVTNGQWCPTFSPRSEEGTETCPDAQ